MRENVFRQLLGNMDELTEVHCAMNIELEECVNKMGARFVGKLALIRK